MGIDLPPSTKETQVLPGNTDSAWSGLAADTWHFAKNASVGLGNRVSDDWKHFSDHPVQSTIELSGIPLMAVAAAAGFVVATPEEAAGALAALGYARLGAVAGASIAAVDAHLVSQVLDEHETAWQQTADARAVLRDQGNHSNKDISNAEKTIQEAAGGVALSDASLLAGLAGGMLARIFEGPVTSATKPLGSSNEPGTGIKGSEAPGAAGLSAQSEGTTDSLGSDKIGAGGVIIKGPERLQASLAPGQQRLFINEFTPDGLPPWRSKSGLEVRISHNQLPDGQWQVALKFSNGQTWEKVPGENSWRVTTRKVNGVEEVTTFKGNVILESRSDNVDLASSNGNNNLVFQGRSGVRILDPDGRDMETAWTRDGGITITRENGEPRGIHRKAGGFIDFYQLAPGGQPEHFVLQGVGGGSALGAGRWQFDTATGLGDNVAATVQFNPDFSVSVTTIDGVEHVFKPKLPPPPEAPMLPTPRPSVTH